MPNPRPALQAILQMLKTLPSRSGGAIQVPVEGGTSSMLESLKGLLAAGGGKKLFQPQGVESPEASRRLILNFLRKTGRGEGAEYLQTTSKKRAWEATLDLASEKGHPNPRLEEIKAMMAELRGMGPEPTTAFRGTDLRKRLAEMGEEFGRPFTRPTREQARFSAMETRKRLYRTASLPKNFVRDTDVGVQGLTGKQLTPEQLKQFSELELPEIGGRFSLTRLENLLGKRVEAMQPFFARGDRAKMKLRSGRGQRAAQSREFFTGGPSFDPTAGPKAGGAGIFRGAQQLGESLASRRNAAEGTAILMREVGGETRSVNELVEMMMGSMEAGIRTGGVETTQAGRRMLDVARSMRQKQRGSFLGGPQQVSGSLDALLGPLRDISSAERGPRKEALAKLKAKVLGLMGETYTGGAT